MSDSLGKPCEDWFPERHLVPAILAGAGAGRRLRDLCSQDRAWVIAGLTSEGLTAERTSDLLKCDVRTVRAVKASAFYSVCEAYFAQAEAFAGEAALADSELRAANLKIGELTGELARVQGHLSRIIDMHIAGEVRTCPRCGTPMDKYNTWTEPQTGRKHCRCCRRDRMKAYRESKKNCSTVSDSREEDAESTRPG